MSDIDEKQRRSTFRRLFVIPFGRFRRHSSTTKYDGSVFVGREGSTAYLIDALTSNSKRGSYIVTGRRGVGKTTFVEKCVNEAEQLKFRRFMRRSAGRTPIDWIVIFISFLAFLLLITADLEILGVHDPSEVRYSDHILNTILRVPPILIGLYGIYCIRCVVISIGFFGWIINTLITLVTTMVIVLFLDTEDQLYNIACAEIALLILLCFGDEIGILLERKKSLLLKNAIWRIALFITLSIIFFKVSSLIYDINLTDSNTYALSNFYSIENKTITGLITTTYPIISSATIIGLIYLSSKCFILIVKFSHIIASEYCKTVSDTNRQTRTKNITLLTLSIPSFVLVLFLTYWLIFILGLKSEEYPSSIMFLGVSATALAKCYIDIVFVRPTQKIARPVEVLLLLKSIALISISAYSIKTVLDNESSSQEFLWLFLSCLVLFTIFSMEFSWITRAFARLRYPIFLRSSREEGGKHVHFNDPSWAWHKDKTSKGEHTKFGEGSDAAISASTSENMFRLLNKATFSSALIRFWTPSIVVRINLGFDSLEHKSVIHAMLHGLHVQYKKAFFLGLNPYRILGLTARLVVVLLIVSTVSKTFINFPELRKTDIGIKDDKQVPEAVRVDIKNSSVDLMGATLPCNAVMIHASKSDLTKINPLGIIYELCRSYPNTLNTVLPIIYTPLLKLSPKPNTQESTEDSTFQNQTEGNADQDSNSSSPVVLDLLLHKHFDLPTYDSTTGFFTQKSSYDFRVFHAVLFFVVFWLITPLLSYFAPMPYRRNLAKIEELANSLTNSTTGSKRRGKWSIASFVSSLSTLDNQEEYARLPLDSRSVELAFMTLLAELADPRIISGPNFFLTHAPAPDIIFIFDELDKLGASPSPEEGRYSNKVNNSQEERLRSEALHEMLSDMKRLISSAPARFIFAGNRTLHDEYMADEGRREPLLTTIFDADLYLPSLLLDLSQIDSIYKNSDRDNHSRMELRIREYVQKTYRLASDYNMKQRDDWQSNLHLVSGGKQSESATFDFTGKDDEYLKVIEWNFLSKKNILKKLNGNEIAAKHILQIHDQIGIKFLHEFYGFLAFRSKGIPKKLGDIIAGYIRPGQRLLLKEHGSARASELEYALEDAQDVLIFNHANLYRVQFINTLFRQMTTSFQTQLLERDDKVTIDVLYLFDFIFKFHGRAFSWSNLEHVDELAHIYKTPDLRRTISEVLDAGIGRYLHPVLNGMYSFRFRSEFAAEVRHLSKLSEAEMAAFNFTLDESQTLKANYSRMIRESDQTNEDMMVALGELHEYDQEYELARGWYYSALFLNDREFSQYVGKQVDVTDKLRDSLLGGNKLDASPTSVSVIEKAAGLLKPPERVPYIKALLTGDEVARKSITVHLPWATRRIRLLLQIGLTYEQTYDFERARSYYYSAHKLASVLTDEIRDRAVESNPSQAANSAWFAMACDDLEILYQPAFASAWVAEKSVGSIDGAIDIVEFELQELHRRISPRVNDPLNIYSKLEYIPEELKKRMFRNFAMLGAEAHNKAGDLHFFKGCKSSLSDSIGRHEFLIKAANHYSCALSLISGYLRLRETQGVSFVRDSAGIPSFISQLVYSNISDIAETTFATISIDALHEEFVAGELEPSENHYTELLSSVDFEDLMAESDKLLSDYILKGCDGKPTSRSINVHKRPEVEDGNKVLLEMLGFWEALALDDLSWYENPEIYREAEIKLFKSNSEALIRSIVFSSLGANIAEHTGLKRTAIDEYVMTLELVERVLKWIRLFEFTHSENYDHEMRFNCLYYSIITFLSNTTIYCLEKIGHLYHRHQFVKKGNEVKKPPGLPDERVLTDAASQGCAILLSLSGIVFKSIQFHIVKKTDDSVYRIGCNPDSQISDIIETKCQHIKSLLEAWFDIDNDWIEIPRSYESSENLDHLNLDYYDFESTTSWKAEDDESKIFQMCEFRRFSRSRLIFLNDRYCFPFLACLQRLKFLVDDVFLSDNSQYVPDKIRVRREKEANRWLVDLVEGAERFDNTTIFTNLELAESSFLKEVCVANPTTDFTTNPSHRFATLAVQSITMGNEYYRNIRKMVYLFDDFNDRRVHFKHAVQMGGKDVARLILNRRR